MPIPDTLARKITADFRAEKSMGAEKKIVTLWLLYLIMYLICACFHSGTLPSGTGTGTRYFLFTRYRYRYR